MTDDLSEAVLDAIGQYENGELTFHSADDVRDRLDRDGDRDD